MSTGYNMNKNDDKCNHDAELLPCPTSVALRYFYFIIIVPEKMCIHVHLNSYMCLSAVFLS